MRQGSACFRFCLANDRIAKLLLPMHWNREYKYGLFQNSYALILDNPKFKEWRTHPDRGLFWIR